MNVRKKMELSALNEWFKSYLGMYHSCPPAHMILARELRCRDASNAELCETTADYIRGALSWRRQQTQDAHIRAAAPGYAAQY